MKFSVPLVPILKNERDRKHWSWKRREQERWLPFFAVVISQVARLNPLGHLEQFIFHQQIKRRLTITVHWGKQGRLPDQAGWIVGIQPVIDLLGTVKPGPYVRTNPSGRKTVVDAIKLGFIWDDAPEWCEIIYELVVRDTKSWTEFEIV